MYREYALVGSLPPPGKRPFPMKISVFFVFVILKNNSDTQFGFLFSAGKYSL